MFLCSNLRFRLFHSIIEDYKRDLLGGQTAMWHIVACLFLRERETCLGTNSHVAHSCMLVSKRERDLLGGQTAMWHIVACLFLRERETCLRDKQPCGT